MCDDIFKDISLISKHNLDLSSIVYKFTLKWKWLMSVNRRDQDLRMLYSFRVNGSSIQTYEHLYYDRNTDESSRIFIFNPSGYTSVIITICNKILLFG